MQDPLTLLLLGPSAKGVPCLLGVATLSLQIEGIDSSFSSTCSKRAQPITLVSPAGDKIGCIHVAARLVCCQPAAAFPRPPSQLLCNLVFSQEPPVTASSAAAWQADQHEDAPAVATEQPVVLARQVSAAMQTDALGPQHATSTQLLQHQASCTQADTATSTLEVVQSPQLQQSQPPCIIQSPHFHIYLPATKTASEAPAQQQPVHSPPVFNISQPAFIFPPPPVQPVLTALPESQSAEGHVISASDVAQQQLQHLQAADTQVPASLMVAQAPAAACVAKLAEAREDFESWRPATAVPHMSSTALAEAGNVPGVHAEASVAPVAGQYCSTARALRLRSPHHVCHHQVF